MTLGEIITDVQVWLKQRPEATPELIRRIFNKVYLSMAMPFRFHETEGSVALNVVANTSVYALTSSQLYALESAWDSYYGRELAIKDIKDYKPNINYEYEGQPETVIRYGNNVRLTPIPDYTYAGAIMLYGKVLPAKLVDDAESPVYPEDWHWILELQTAAVISFMLGMEERAQMLQNMALGQLTGRQEAHTIEAFHKLIGIKIDKKVNSHGDVEIRS